MRGCWVHSYLGWRAESLIEMLSFCSGGAFFFFFVLSCFFNCLLVVFYVGCCFFLGLGCFS